MEVNAMAQMESGKLFREVLQEAQFQSIPSSNLSFTLPKVLQDGDCRINHFLRACC